MIELHELLAQLVALSGGKVVGKTRLQKTVFLLDRCGLNTGCRYDYHYYGPFSARIAEAAEDACELRLLKFDERQGFHAVPYGIYESSRDVDIPDKIGDLTQDAVKEKLTAMSRYSAIELELAATILYLRDGGFGDAVKSVKQLKSAKATPERVDRALRLLGELNLS